MNYEEYVKEAIENEKYESGEVFALLAIADRLDRLCKIMSRGN